MENEFASSISFVAVAIAVFAAIAMDAGEPDNGDDDQDDFA